MWISSPLSARQSTSAKDFVRAVWSEGKSYIFFSSENQFSTESSCDSGCRTARKHLVVTPGIFLFWFPGYLYLSWHFFFSLSRRIKKKNKKFILCYLIFLWYSWQNMARCEHKKMTVTTFAMQKARGQYHREIIVLFNNISPDIIQQQK